MIKKVAIGIAVLLAIVLGLAAIKPDTFTVQRSIAIQAPPEKIMGLVADFHHWTRWSPWEALDPDMQRGYAGPASGEGAVYTWKGNAEVGEGRMEITGMTPPTRLVIKLDFIDPFESSNVTEFVLSPQGDTTTVTWSMTGPMPFISKIMSVFKSMDAMIGPDFERGLARLKAVAEK